MSSPPRSARKPNARPSSVRSNSPPNAPDSPSPRWVTAPPGSAAGSPTPPPRGCGPTSKRSPHPAASAIEGDGEHPHPRLLGLALTDLLETLPADVLPAPWRDRDHRDRDLDHDQLTASLETAGIATLETGDPITASQARRLACTAKIIPAVLGGKSEVLDFGRKERSSPPPNAKRSCCDTATSEDEGAHPRQPGPRPTTATPGPKAGRPTSTTPPCSAAITTTAPTTPHTSTNACPTATSASPDGHRPPIYRLD